MATAKAEQEQSVQPLLERAGTYLPPARLKLVEEAYQFAEAAHEGQLRKSGEPYIVHPLDAAMTVADLQLDAAAIAAALLHDVQEDCAVPNQELKRLFGADVAKLVDGVTKLKRIPFQSAEPGAVESGMQAENLRKMLLAMAGDVRV